MCFVVVVVVVVVVVLLLLLFVGFLFYFDSSCPQCSPKNTKLVRLNLFNRIKANQIWLRIHLAI